jgi:lysozyme family protein
MAREVTAVDRVAARLLGVEGGFTNVPGDHGGMTALGGQTRAWLEALYGRTVTDAELRGMTPKKAAENIAAWLALYGLDALLTDDGPDALAIAVIDWAYMSGEPTAIVALQKILGVSPTAPHVGPQTLAALSGKNRHRVADLVRAAQLRFEGRIFERDYRQSTTDVMNVLATVVTNGQLLDAVRRVLTSRQEKFAAGWLNRCASNIETYE